MAEAKGIDMAIYMGIMYASASEWLRPRVWNTDFG
jgi:hypothetical protein